MPANMFQEWVSSRADKSRNWYTLPLSFMVHTSVLAVLIVVPLIATDVLPMPRSALEFHFIPAAPSVPAAPPSRRVDSPSLAPSRDVAPVVAPETIGVESGLVPPQETVATGGIESVFAGSGSLHISDEVPPPVTTAPPEPVRPGGAIKPPIRIHYQVPDYPVIARLNKVQGVVIIEATIGVDGKVQDARILRSIPLLDRAALDAVRSWEYTPTLLNGKPTAVIMTVTVQFTLN